MNPHAALLLAQLIGSVNSVISRAAFVSSPDDDARTTNVPTPLTFAVWRVLIASTVLTILRYCIVKRPSPHQNLSAKKRSNKHDQVERNEHEKEAVKFFSAAATALSGNNQEQEEEGIISFLFTPSPHPSVAAILQVCLLGCLVITGNFTFFFFGVAFTDAISLAAMMCLVPSITFVFGYFLGLETFSIPKALSTLLVVCGNFVMAHVWRVFPGVSSLHNNNNNNNNNSSAMEMNEHHVRQAENSANHPDQHHSHHHVVQHSYLLGVFFLFLAFTCWSLYLLLQRSIVKQMHLLDFLFYLYWSALAGLLTISVFHPEGESIFRQIFQNELSQFSYMAIFFAGSVHSIGTYFLVSYATCKADSSLLAALYNGLMPLFVTVEAILFLGESMDEWQVIGGGIVICGWICSMIAISKGSHHDSSHTNNIPLFGKGKEEEREEKRY